MLGGLLVALILGGLGAWKINSWRIAADDRDRAIAERDMAIADLNFYINALRDAQKASNDYQKELANIRIANSRERTPVVRLCKQPTVSKPRPLPPAGSGPHDSPASAGPLPPATEVQVGPDIGPGLFADADRSDELSAQVRGLQAYAVSCSGNK